MRNAVWHTPLELVAARFPMSECFAIYAGTSPEHLDEVVDLPLHELRQVVNESVSEEELKLAKEQAVSSILLGLESSSARASALARQEIIHHRRITPDEVLRRIEAVNSSEVQEVARRCFTSESLALGALGNLNGFRIDRSRSDPTEPRGDATLTRRRMKYDPRASHEPTRD